jgi:hypothetical protein
MLRADRKTGLVGGLPIAFLKEMIVKGLWLALLGLTMMSILRQGFLAK